MTAATHTQLAAIARFIRSARRVAYETAQSAALQRVALSEVTLPCQQRPRSLIGGDAPRRVEVIVDAIGGITKFLGSAPKTRAGISLTLRRAVRTVGTRGGASEGIGGAWADYATSQGLSVAIVARDPEKLEKKRQELVSRFGVEVLAISQELGATDAVENIHRRRRRPRNRILGVQRRSGHGGRILGQ